MCDAQIDNVHMYIHLSDAYMHVCMHVCIYIYIYIHMYLFMLSHHTFFYLLLRIQFEPTLLARLQSAEFPGHIAG